MVIFFFQIGGILISMDKITAEKTIREFEQSLNDPEWLRGIGLGLDEDKNYCIFVYVSSKIQIPSVFEGIKIKVIKTKDFKAQ